MLQALPPTARRVRQKIPRAVLGSSLAVLLAVAVWTWRTSSASHSRTPAASLSKIIPPQAPTPRPADAAAERTQQLQKIAAYWDAHKTHLHQLLAVDYPAAVARRNAATPDYPAVEAFAKAWSEDFKARLEKLASDHRERNDVPLLELMNSHEDILRMPQVLVRDWNDSTPVTDTMSIGDLTHEMLSDPAKLAELRKAMVDDERLVFHDEGTAQRVEAMSTADELIAYATSLQNRYAAAAEQELVGLNASAQTRAFLGTLSDAGTIIAPVQAYLTSHNQEPEAILQEYREVADVMRGTFLAEASADDAEARRLLTEWKDLQVLKPVTINDDWTINDH